MNKKRFFTLAGVIATVLAIGGTSVACYSFEKKNSQKNESQNFTDQKETTVKKYGIPDFVDKYAIPEVFMEPPMAKYAMPPELMIEKPVPSENVQILKYATPPMLQNNEQNYEDEEIMLPKYGIPNPPETDSKMNSNDSTQEQNPWK